VLKELNGDSEDGGIEWFSNDEMDNDVNKMTISLLH